MKNFLGVIHLVNVTHIVFNSVYRDARVLKEARTLADEGYKVTVIGISDANFKATEEKVSKNLVIKLIQNEKKFSLFKFPRENLFLIFIIVFCIFESYKINSYQNLNLFIIHFLWASALGSFLILASSFPSIQSFTRYILFLVNATKLMTSGAIKTSPDIIHCHDIISLPAGLIVKYRTNCMLIYDAHEIYEEVPGLAKIRKKIYCLIHKFAQRQIDGFITINESIADWYKLNYPQLCSSIVVMNATLLPPKQFNYDGRLHILAGLPHDAKILLYQGGFSKYRGLSNLILCAEFLPKNWFLVMMGWGKLGEYLHDIARQVNAKSFNNRGVDVIRFIPPAKQDELVLWTSGADIGIIPYENSGLNHWFCTPNKLWEYPNAGVPLLVSPFPEMSKMINQYNHGWLLPESLNPYEIGKFISSLSKNKILKAKKNTQTFARENHWGVFTSLLIELYCDLSKKMLAKKR